ncbi:hypothetical protein MSIMFI_05332 [Mycobacterium simulans]|nr:hypothetical protein MSIMFI_05332 [Mycobacterium simulans]
MVVAAGVAETFEHEDASTFAPAGAIGGRRERFAAPIDGQSPLAGELGEDERSGHDRGATRERQAGFAVAQGLTCEMGGDQ